MHNCDKSVCTGRHPHPELHPLPTHSRKWPRPMLHICGQASSSTGECFIYFSNRHRTPCDPRMRTSFPLGPLHSGTQQQHKALRFCCVPPRAHALRHLLLAAAQQVTPALARGRTARRAGLCSARLQLLRRVAELPVQVATRVLPAGTCWCL